MGIVSSTGYLAQVDFPQKRVIDRQNFLARTITLHFSERFLLVGNSENLSIAYYDTGVNPALNISGLNVGSAPAGIFHDGRFVWVLVSTGSVLKIDYEAGTVIETIALTASSYRGLTGDGRYFWIADLTGGNIQQYDKGFTLIDTFTAPSEVRDLFFDGRFLFILTGNSGSTGSIRQYDPIVGTQIDAMTLATYGTLPAERANGLTGDGRYLWLAEQLV
jgi:hypothetical protein